MFKFLKKKLKESAKTFSEEAENEAEHIPAEEVAEKEDSSEEQEGTNETRTEKKQENEDEGKEEERKKEEKETSPEEETGKEESTSEKQDDQPVTEQKEDEEKTKEQEKEKASEQQDEKQVPDNEDADTSQEKKGKKGFLGKVFSTKKKQNKEPEEIETEKESGKEESTSEKQDDQPVTEQKEHKEKASEQQEKEDTPAAESKKKEKKQKSEDEKEEEPRTDATEEKKTAAHEELFDENVKDATSGKKEIFSKIKSSVTKFQLTDEKFDELFWNFELALMENNVAIDIIEKIKKDLKERLTQENVSRRGVEDVILKGLKASLEDVLNVEPVDIIEKAKEKTPYVISIIGVNGSGKTTSIAKLIRLFHEHKFSVVVAAADTFRAAAIQQLEEHTNNLKAPLIKQDYKSDAAAVAYDAVQHAKAKGIDVVLIDTAGRLQSNKNLMDELEKVIRVNKPDFNLFVGEATTGNDCVEQAMRFEKAVGIDGIILAKADVDEKGGAAISTSYMTQKPILYLGVGQGYDDLEAFSKERVLEHLGLEE